MICNAEGKDEYVNADEEEFWFACMGDLEGESNAKALTVSVAAFTFAAYLMLWNLWKT